MRLPADMRSRVKVVFKRNEFNQDKDDSDLEGIEKIDWVESKDAKELMKNSSYVSDKGGAVNL